MDVAPVSMRRRGALAVASVTAGYGAASAVLAWASSGVAATVAAPGPAGLDASLGLAAAVAAWAVLSWLAATTVLAVVAAALAGAGSLPARAAARLSPAGARRLAALLLGAGLTAAPLVLAAPALGAEGGRPPLPAASPAAGPASGQAARQEPGPLPEPDRPAPDLAGWTPDRPAAPAPVRPQASVRLVTAPAHAEHAVVDEVVVRRGDRLWDIAARHLGPHASAADVAQEWPRWYAVNRVVIGPDPDLLLPGQRLVPPPH